MEQTNMDIKNINFNLQLCIISEFFVCVGVFFLSVILYLLVVKII